MEELIEKFLQVGYGSGSGSGSGYGSGDGSGDGYGYGYGSGDGYGFGSGDGFGDGFGDGDGSVSGYGDGSGSGYGDGDGYGSGSGVEIFNGQRVYIVDDTPTLIDAVHGNYAKGRILKSDLTTEPCYIAKAGDFFAHGQTLKKALADAQNKYDKNKPLDERIADFKATYPTLDAKCKGSDLFRWHNVLTGSCEFGRKTFCNEHGIDPGTTSMTVSEFIELTKNAYGGNAIKQLRKAYD